jgi:hypothetical protein
MLWNLLGPSSLVGIGVMILMMPIQGFISKKLIVIQKTKMQLNDQRTKMLNEILNGIRGNYFLILP